MEPKRATSISKMTRAQLVFQNELLKAQVDEIRSKEEQSLDVIRRAPTAIYEVDFHGPRLKSVNDYMCQATGYSREELLAINPFDLLDADSKARFQERIKKQLSGDKIDDTVEYTGRAKDGHIMTWVLKMAFTYVNGQPIGAIVVAHDATGQKKIEETLRASEEEYRHIVEYAPTAIYEMDHLGRRFTRVNDAMCQILGYTREELLAMDPASLLDDTSKALFQDRIRQVLAGEKVDETIVFRIFGQGGREIWTSLNTKIVFQDGKPAHALVVAQDITARKKTEEELRESEARFRSVLDNSTDCIYRLNLQTGRYEYISPSCERMVGYTPGELRALDLETTLAMIHPEDRPALRAAVARCLEAGKAGVEYRQRTKSGRYIWISNNMSLVRDPAGRPLYRDGTQRDITRRKRNEEAIRKSEEFLDNIFNCIQDGISILDKDLNIIKTNHVMEEWYPHMVPLVGKKCFHAYHMRDMPCEVCPSIKAIRDKTMQKAIVPFTGEAGQKGWMELYSYPMIDANGDVYGVVEHVRDVTERQRAEEELIAARQQAELYLDLMGHDINNLHQVALGYLELAQDMHPDIGQKELLEKPIEVLQRSARLIKNVQKLQKHRHGIFKTEKMSLQAVLRNVQKEFGGVPGKTISLNANGHEKGLVRANELLHDVFANLVSNAVRHTGDNANITIDLDRINDNGSYYRVIVEDDGPGIPDDSKPYIFNRMYKGTARGMGLGLYLVKTLVESYGGRVWVEDRIRGDYTKGARFVVMLPAMET